jgi:hypothetical protein
MSSKGRRTEKLETVRSAALYDTIERERVARGWRVRQFSDWLGLGDRLYKWRNIKPANLPEAETLIRMAVRLEWPLDRLLRGVSAAYDAQVAARALNTGMEQQPTTRTSNGGGGEWNELHARIQKPVTKPTDIPAERDQHAALLDLLTPEQWALVRVIVGLGPEEATQARQLIRRWIGQREEPQDAAREPDANQGGSAKTDRSGPDRR